MIAQLLGGNGGIRREKKGFIRQDRRPKRESSIAKKCVSSTGKSIRNQKKRSVWVNSCKE